MRLEISYRLNTIKAPSALDGVRLGEGLVLIRKFVEVVAVLLTGERGAVFVDAF